MIQKRLFSQLALAVVAAAVLTACGKKEEAAPAAAASPTATPTKAGRSSTVALKLLAALLA
jgi:hypothetical protein